jgi:hypothetical protein
MAPTEAFSHPEVEITNNMLGAFATHPCESSATEVTEVNQVVILHHTVFNAVA